MNERKPILRKKFRKKELKSKKGITLIALVITIIVMLILAGVSLNATIGENGILSQAKNATYMESKAILEEYLQQKYVENYDDIDSSDNKILQLQDIYPEYFYIPAREGIGNLKYIVNNEGNSLYLIKKSGLPKEIQKSLKDGNAGSGTYSDYRNLNDVYGITSDLKVYYSSGSGNALIGITKDELDIDDPFREVFAAGSSYSNLINMGDSSKNVTAEEIKKVKDLKISSDSGITSLDELSNFISLQSLTLEDYNGSLSGIQNATGIYYLYMKNCEISNYSYIGGLNNKLKYLYLYCTNDDEISKLCSKNLGIASYDMEELEYLGIMGADLINNAHIKLYGYQYHTWMTEKAPKIITSVENLNNLTQITKEKIKYLFLNNNAIKSLNGIEGFKNIYLLRVEYNEIKDLTGINNMNNLTYLFANNNQLGIEEIYDETLENSGKDSTKDVMNILKDKNNLYYLNIENNNLRWLGYIADRENIKNIYLANNTTLCDVSSIINIICNAYEYSLDSKYSLEIIDVENTQVLDLKDFTLSYSNLEYISNCKNLERLRLDNVKIMDNSNNVILDEIVITDKIVNCLKNYSKMKSLSLINLDKLKSITFVDNMPDLRYIDLRGCGCIDLSNLNNLNYLSCFFIDNSNIDLTKIQTAISKATGSGEQYWIGNYNSGFLCKNTILIKQLEQCSEITNLRLGIHDFGYYNYDIILDLSKCEKLKYLNGVAFNTKKIILPSSLEGIDEWAYSSTILDFSNCKNLRYFKLVLQDGSEEFWTEIFKTLKDCTKLTTLDMYRCNGFTDLNCFEPLKNLNITTISLGGYHYYYDYYLTSLDGIQYFPNLINLNIAYCPKLNDLDGLSYLNKLENVNISYCELLKNVNFLNGCTSVKAISCTNCNIEDISALSTIQGLKNINFSNNKISNLKALEDLIYLETASLTNNVIYDTASYFDENNIIRVNNIDILSNLNIYINGSLINLYLQGNTGIIDFSKLSSLNWNDKSGF